MLRLSLTFLVICMYLNDTLSLDDNNSHSSYFYKLRLAHSDQSNQTTGNIAEKTVAKWVNIEIVSVPTVKTKILLTYYTKISINNYKFNRK
jgi:hypothetical protein